MIQRAGVEHSCAAATALIDRVQQLQILVIGVGST